MKPTPHADTVIRVVAPELAAEKLGWTLADVLKRRAELGLGEFVGCRRKRKRPAPAKPVKPKRSKG